MREQRTTHVLHHANDRQAHLLRVRDVSSAAFTHSWNVDVGSRAFLQNDSSLRTSASDTSCGVVTMTAPDTPHSCRY